MAVLIVFSAMAFYLLAMTALNASKWQNRFWAEPKAVELDPELYLKESRPIPEYGGVQRIYEIPVTWGLYDRVDIGLWMVHSYVTVFMGNDLIYQNSEPEDWHIGHSPGSYWAFLPVRHIDIGKTMRIMVTPAYKEVQNRAPRIFAGRRDKIVGYRLLDEAAIVCVGLLCIIVGISFFILSVSAGVHIRENRVVFYLGIILFLLGIWKFTDTPSVYAVMLSWNRLLTWLSLLTLMLLVPAISQYLYLLEPRERIYLYANHLFLVLDTVLLALQICNIRDLRQNLLLLEDGIMVFVVFLLEKNLYGLRKNISDWHKWSFIAIGVSAIADLIIYSYGFSSFYLGVTLTVTLFYGVLNGVILLIHAAGRQEELRRKALQLKESRMALMMSQIRPHFIYNTLNAIYVLCAKDAEKARQAIYDFSRYLRINFENMDRTAPVSFGEELEHVRFYLSIEQLRFPDALQVEYDIKSRDFSLPALSLQPIVENAVRHGIRASHERGKIRISSFTEDGMDCVVIEDDGEGFDVAAWEKSLLENDGRDEGGRRHVGLANVRNRIREYGGNLRIESRPEKGTRMIVSMPVAEKDGMSDEKQE